VLTCPARPFALLAVLGAYCAATLNLVIRAIHSGMNVKQPLHKELSAPIKSYDMHQALLSSGSGWCDLPALDKI
jgi:hypothetical protein